MGENRQFVPGQEAPNDGEYIEIGETGVNVMDPQIVRLRKGDRFPDTTNHNRKWARK